MSRWSISSLLFLFYSEDGLSNKFAEEFYAAFISLDELLFFEATSFY